MFGLFKSHDNDIKVVDKVWMSSTAKWNACHAMSQADPNRVFIAWFPETLSTLQQYVTPIQALLADSASQSFPANLIVFVEHYPLISVEQDLFSKLGLREAPVLSALDEPFFEKFGGTKTIELMKKLGMAEDEMIGHSMITKSIKNAQSKIANKVRLEQKAMSQREWFEKNLK